MLVPEIILYNTVKAFFNLLSSDYNAASDKNETIIHDLFAVDNNDNNLVWENVTYFDQACALFGRTDQSPRRFKVNIGYNLQHAFLPAVHILLPQETHGRYDSIGYSQGEVATEYHPEASPQYQIDTLTRTYRATFDLLITSDNTTDVLLVYYALKSLFPYCGDTFELLGLHNFVTTGMDVQLDEKYAPPNIFHRTLRTEFDYQSQTKVRKLNNFGPYLFQICSNIGDENKPMQSSPNRQVSDNYSINVTKTGPLGVVGFINFTNKITFDEQQIPLDFSSQGSNSFQLTGNLDPAPYDVQLVLQNFGNKNVSGYISDGAMAEADFDTRGQFYFDQTFNMSIARTPNLIVSLNFS